MKYGFTMARQNSQIISRRKLLNAATAVIGTLSILPSALFAKSAKPNPQKPNIIFILADDMGYADLSCTGSHHIKTPNIDSIASNGVFFTQGYSSSSICSPTRTALATGCYQQRFELGLYEPLNPNAPKGLGIPANRRTIASVLRENGYQTSLVGKWHLGEIPEHGPLAHGYDSFYGVEQGAADYFKHRIYANGAPISSGMFRDNNPIEEHGYLTDLLGDEAVKLINSKSDKPIFMSLHFTAPHWPWEGREDEIIANNLKSTFHTDGGNLETYAKIVEALDDNVGKVIAALKANGQYENSIIVFTSDNGGERFSETWPFIGVKGELLEGGIRVPLLVQWANRIKAGQKNDQVMASMDFLPTFLAIAGGKAKPNEFDGMDLSQQFLGQKPSVERTLFWRFHANEQAAVRKGDWKYLKLGGKEHLFNLAQDVRERAELKDDYPEKLAELKNLYANWNAQMLPYGEKIYSSQVKSSYSDRY